MKGEKEKLDFSNEEIYQRISLLDLIIIAIYSLQIQKKSVSFEDILERSFSLFPKAFSFRKFPQWPDARKLDRPLRSLRSKNLIKGDPKDYFSLTVKGRRRAEELIKKFYQKKLFNI